MGFFDKFFDILKSQRPGEVPAELMNEPDFPDEPDVIMPAKDNAGTNFEKADALLSRDEYTTRFRATFMHLFPNSLDTLESHMQLPYMVNSAVNIAPVIEYAEKEIYSRFKAEPEKLVELSRAAVTKVALALEKYLSELDSEQFQSSCGLAHMDSLGKAWIVLDFYCRMMKRDFAESIALLQDVITDEIIARGFLSDVITAEKEYEYHLDKCSELVLAGNESPNIWVAKRELLEKLFALDCIFVIYCKAFGKAYPFVDTDGRVEITTNKKSAQALKERLSENGTVDVTIVEYKKEQYEKFFSEMLHNGIFVIRPDGEKSNVEIDIRDYYTNDEENILEVSNRYVRGMFIRKLQYKYRLENLPEDKVDSDEYSTLSSAMLSAGNRGLRAFAGGLFYALYDGKTNEGDTTLYTPRAMERAKELMVVLGETDESILIANNDRAYDVLETEPTLKSIRKKGAENGFVCAFSDKESAEIIRKRFCDGGAVCSVVVVTPGELCNCCAGSEGFVMDINSYGLEIPVSAFAKISEYVKASGVIVNGKE